MLHILFVCLFVCLFFLKFNLILSRVSIILNFLFRARSAARYASLVIIIKVAVVAKKKFFIIVLWGFVLLIVNYIGTWDSFSQTSLVLFSGAPGLWPELMLAMKV